LLGNSTAEAAKTTPGKGEEQRHSERAGGREGEGNTSSVRGICAGGRLTSIGISEIKGRALVGGAADIAHLEDAMAGSDGVNDVPVSRVTTRPGLVVEDIRSVPCCMRTEIQSNERLKSTAQRGTTDTEEPPNSVSCTVARGATWAIR
jgi:hypothetical protein